MYFLWVFKRFGFSAGAWETSNELPSSYLYSISFCLIIRTCLLLKLWFWNFSLNSMTRSKSCHLNKVSVTGDLLLIHKLEINACVRRWQYDYESDDQTFCKSNKPAIPSSCFNSLLDSNLLFANYHKIIWAYSSTIVARLKSFIVCPWIHVKFWNSL